MERIKELLSRIIELSDEELEELRELVLAEVDGTSEDDGGEAPSDEKMKELSTLVAAGAAYQKEKARRAVAGSPAPLRADASGRTVVPADRRPRAYTRDRGGAGRVLTASGAPIDGHGELLQTVVDAIRRLPTNAPDGHKIVVATAHADRPADQQLRRSDSPQLVTDRFADAAARVGVKALVAAGGYGAPEQTDYVLPGFAVADRPVKGALPGFTAERGGIGFVKPATLADVNGGLGIWTVADDIAAATNSVPRKPTVRVTPGGEVVVDLMAVTASLAFGNMLSRAYPEFVEHVLQLAQAAHARIAEQQTLTQIGALSTAVTGATTRIGATRVLLPLFERAAVGMRNRLRMGTNAPVQLILPDWARPLLRSDLALQEPGDGTVGVTDAELDAYFTARGLVVTWALDGEAGQQFDAQAPNTAINAWPDRVVSYMFPAGAFQFLDGGTLDIGMIRDSTLVAANDYLMFWETFEAVAFRGGEAFRISQPVTPSGITRAAETAA